MPSTKRMGIRLLLLIASMQLLCDCWAVVAESSDTYNTLAQDTLEHISIGSLSGGDGTLSVKQNLRSAVKSNLEDTMAVPEEANEDDASPPFRNLNSLDESAKVACCSAAFNLCERPPDVTPRKFHKTRGRFYPKARQACAKLPFLKGNKLSIHGICNFYRSNPANCALVADSPEDVARYISQAKRCCPLSAQVCNNKSDLSLVYQAEKECFWFAAKTADEICNLQGSFTCTVGSGQ